MDADTDKDPPLIEKEDDTTNPTAFDNDLGVTQGEEKEEHGVVENKKKKKQATESFTGSSLIQLPKKEANTRFEIRKCFELLLFVLSVISNSTFFSISSSFLQDMVKT